MQEQEPEISKTVSLDEGVFHTLRSIVQDYCGILFGEDSRSLFERRLQSRLEETQTISFEDYVKLLQTPGSGKELELAIDLLVVNETYFFREIYQLEAFARDLLPVLHKQALSEGRRTLSIWSAGCSTGEEVYSIAMMILKSGLFGGWEIQVFGNDISYRVLTQARRATYGESSFRAFPEGFDEFFLEDSQGKDGREVHPKVRSMCHFVHFNLIESSRAELVGWVDAVFCRNVLIYLDPQARETVIRTCHRQLRPGGFLMLGHSESLMNIPNDFELTPLGTDFVYRRPLDKPRSLRARESG